MDNRKAYEIFLEKTNTIHDRLGTPIDTGIKPVVAALWLHGFSTSGSCAGHINSISRGPYVHIIPSDFIAKHDRVNELINTGKMADARLFKSRIYDSSLELYTRLFTILNQFYANTKIDYSRQIVTYAQLNGEIYLYFNDVRMADAMNAEARKIWLKECHQELNRLTEFLLALPTNN